MWLPWTFWWHTVQFWKRGEFKLWNAGGTTPIVPVLFAVGRLA